MLSGVNFIWVLRHNAVSYEEPYTLPLRIEHEIKDQGLIVPWCNQVEVILNPAIGGFLTIVDGIRYSKVYGVGFHCSVFLCWAISLLIGSWWLMIGRSESAFVIGSH